MTKQIHVFSCFLTPKRDLRISARRDVGAALDLLPVLFRSGFELGEPILNFPPAERAADHYEETLLPADAPFLRPGGMILQTTRPALDDEGNPARKRVRRGFTDIEDRLFDVWRHYIERCARSEVRLHQRLHKRLAPPFHTRRHMEFREKEGAPYKALNDCAEEGRTATKPASERRTAAFLLRVEEAWDGGPGLIGAFGMDGTATAVWAYRLGRDFAHLMEKPGFTMVEMTNCGVPARPTNMLWAHAWNIEVVLSAPPVSQTRR